MKARPIIENVSMPTANTEYSLDLPTGTKKFTIKLRDPGAIFDLCFVSGETQNYVRITSGKSYTENELKGKNSLFFKSSSANQVAEILYYL